MNILKLNKANNKLVVSELNRSPNHSGGSGPLTQASPASKKGWTSFLQTEAFTIIEVVLVLAIAGLIFLMVFIALPALQRNQRDIQRKQDIDRVLAAVQSYQANNRGRVPGNGDYFRGESTTRYIKIGGDEFKTPTGQDYAFSVDAIRTVENILTHPSRDFTVWVWHSSKCNGEEPVQKDGLNNLVVAIALEGGGVYCINN